MLNRFKQFFDQHLSAAAAEAPNTARHRLQLAAAALLIEMIRVDGDIKEAEAAVVRRALGKAFQLDAAETAELMRLAEQEARDATCYHAFTRLINEHYSKEQKIELVEALWEVAYADAEMEMYEEHLVRKLAELLYVRHAEFIQAKLRVQENQIKEKR
jgi:uncharacterized tellurite resistance protein B-like protein